MNQNFSHPRVSTVIINFNSGILLAECVASVLPQSAEIVIVDNASSDSSLDDCRDKFGQDPKLKIIRNNMNLGFSKACNIGYINSSMEAILFFNPDCTLDIHANAEMLRALFVNIDCGMVGGFLTNPDGSEQRGGRRAVPTPWRSFVSTLGLYHLASRWPRIFSDFHLHRQPVPNNPIEVDAISGACMMVKREAVDSVGLWDEHYFLHCEDLDWCMSFRKKGWKILFVPTAKVVHKLGMCSQTRPFFVEWHRHKGMIRFYHKFFHHQYPSGLMWLVIAGVWIRFGLVCIQRFANRLNDLFIGKHG